MSEQKYELVVNESQLRLIQESLDLYSRVLLGQFEEIGWVAIQYNINKLKDDSPSRTSYAEHHEFTNKIREIKTILGFHPNESYGIFNQNVHDDSRVSYDMIQVIRKFLAEKYYKPGDSRMGVNFDEVHKSSQTDLIELKESSI